VVWSVKGNSCRAIGSAGRYLGNGPVLRMVYVCSDSALGSASKSISRRPKRGQRLNDKVSAWEGLSMLELELEIRYIIPGSNTSRIQRGAIVAGFCGG
jgi:hypothetical protein